MSLAKDGQYKDLTNADIDRITRKLHDACLIHSCMTCEHFNADESKSLEPYDPEMGDGFCRLYHIFPPPKIVAYGCPSWEEGLPF